MNLYLTKIQDIFLVPRDLYVGDLESFMINVRLVLETEGLKEKYKVLNLYCNWCLHTSIKESITAYKILEYITQSIISHNQNEDDPKWIHDAIIEGLKFHELQVEIVAFVEYFNLNIQQFRDENFWRGFGMTLVHNLIERPIALNNNTNKKKLKEIIQNIETTCKEAKQTQFAVLSLEFIYMDEQQYFRILSGLNDNPTNILGKVYIPTYEEFLKHNQNHKK